MGDGPMAKDEANPQVRGAMERRWDEARKDCTKGSCPPAYRFHVKGCERRRAYMAGDRKAADTAVVVPDFQTPLVDLLTAEEKDMVVSYDTSPTQVPAAMQPKPEQVIARQSALVRLESSMLAGPAPDRRPWWKFWGRG